MNHVDKLVHLLDDLFESLGISRDVDGHSREGPGAALGDHERIYIISSPREDLANTHQDSWAIVYENGKRV